MSEEYIIVRANRHGETITKLIHHNELVAEGGDINDFFESFCEDVEEIGRVQVMGDTKCLDTFYVSEE